MNFLTMYLFIYELLKRAYTCRHRIGFDFIRIDHLIRKLFVVKIKRHAHILRIKFNFFELVLEALSQNGHVDKVR